MEPDEPEQEEQGTEEPDNGQGNAAETGGIGQPTIREEKQHNKKTGETGITGQPIIREKTGKEQAVKKEPMRHPTMQERRRNKHAVGLGIIELPGIPEEDGDLQTVKPGIIELPGIPKEDGDIQIVKPATDELPRIPGEEGNLQVVKPVPNEHPGVPEGEGDIQAVKSGTTELPGISVKEDPGQSAGTEPGENPIMPEKKPTGQPPRTVPGTTPGADQGRPGALGTPRGPGKKRRPQKKPPIARPVTEVYRKTEMPGMSAKSFPEDPAQIRRQTERDLKNPGFGIPYAATEKAVRDLVCSLVEREDRIHAGFLLDIDCMQQDIGMLKDQVYALKTMKTGAAAGEKK